MKWMKRSRAAIWVFILALLPGLALTASVQWAANRQAKAEFDRTAELAVDRVVSRMRQHVVALRATRGLWEAELGAVTPQEFRRFMTSVDLVNELSGARGVGFAPMIATGDDAAVEASIADYYGLAVSVEPETDQRWRTPVLMLEPLDDSTIRALGFDMYSEATRREAMERAIATGEARISGPIELVSVTGEENRAGFLIFLPRQSKDAAPAPGSPPVEGFVYAAFRGQDLIEAALAAGPPLSVSMTVVDTGDLGLPLYDGGQGQDGLRRQIPVKILGREWMFDVQSAEPASATVAWADLAIFALLSVLFAYAVASAAAARQKEAAQARELAAASVREAEYRDLLVQEMKHRIKNYITRVQSIARQSAAGATDVKAFSETFNARLSAMAAVQEILAGTVAAQADLRKILAKELQQAIDPARIEQVLEGPEVRLEERQAHAFALVAHELTTNAMKYGGLSPAGKGLKVSWLVMDAGPDQLRRVILTWRETTDGVPQDPKKRSGFGSRLIDASLKGELSGTIEREFLADGLRAILSFPLAAQPVAGLAKGSV